MNIVWLPRDERVNPCHQVSAHLTIAVFPDLQRKQSIRILPELYYDDPKEAEIALIPLVEDTCSEAIAKFPEVLHGLVKYVTTNKLRALHKGINPVELTIYLFLPVEFLGYSLKYWCSESSKLATSYPVVVGCSDRFNPDRDDSWRLHNQLKKGWERLSKSATALRQVKWIQPDESFNGDLERYAGLQCFGHWLKSGEKYLDRWEKLVESGIPLALWMCEVEADREAIAQTFNSLTDCNVSEFLQRVRQERRQPSISVANSGYHLGVFYEDPNYVPTVPPQDEDEPFFSWPQ
ncbi:hypothetical protein NG799_03335 [Laspinema sp. D1]|uniref:vWA-MoxR associated protein C-terminal domain-containing protein n=1 Tax=Laspinema palackyanum D2a TaxID=2953684 RepID=A0ABT2MKU1_9CYAN|nr:hypothetical protein [Laspinema sp. D2a]